MNEWQSHKCHLRDSASDKCIACYNCCELLFVHKFVAIQSKVMLYQMLLFVDIYSIYNLRKEKLVNDMNN